MPMLCITSRRSGERRHSGRFELNSNLYTLIHYSHSLTLGCSQPVSTRAFPPSFTESTESQKQRRKRVQI